jgi:hypothetical protein
MLAKHLDLLFMVSLLVSSRCATSSKHQQTAVGPHCSISPDMTNDPKVTGYQLTLIDQSNQAKKIVQFIPAETPQISCTDVGADHERLWAVTVQSCYDKLTCGSPTDVALMQITAK